MFKLASTALKSRDEDLNEAIEALGDREADQEIKAENKKLKKENRELKKENKEQDKQLKRFQKAKSEGTARYIAHGLENVFQRFHEIFKLVFWTLFLIEVFLNKNLTNFKCQCP